MAKTNESKQSWLDETTQSPLIDEHVQKLNGQLERWETIKKFIILPRDLTVEDGELTPSMKVRRKIVEQKYMSELDSLYR